MSVSQTLSDLINQKTKYHNKVVSTDAEVTMVQRSAQTYDFFKSMAQDTVTPLSFAAISVAFTLNTDLFNVEPINFDFSYRMPTIDEWMRGVNIVIEKFVPTYATTIMQFISESFSPEYMGSLLQTQIEKAVFDESYYGYSYYDPPAVAAFLRGTIAMLFNTHANMVDRRIAIESLAKALNVNPSLAKAVHDRIAMVASMLTDCFSLGMSYLGKSKLCKEEHHSPQVGVFQFTDLSNMLVEVGASNPSQVVSGFLLGYTPLGYGALVPEETIFAKPSPAIFNFIEMRTLDNVFRYPLMPLAISNYVTGAEAEKVFKSERSEIWAQLMTLRYVYEQTVRTVVDRLLPGLDPMKRRLYITAALRLFSALRKKRKWGYRTYTLMTLSEIRSWWIELFTARGLDPMILDMMFSYLTPILVRVASLVDSQIEWFKKRRRGLI